LTNQAYLFFILSRIIHKCDHVPFLYFYIQKRFSFYIIFSVIPATNQPDAYTKQEQKLTSTNLPLSVIALLTKTDYNYKERYKFYGYKNYNMKETISY